MSRHDAKVEDFMIAATRIKKRGSFRVLLVRGAYLTTVWGWLLVCFLFPTWIGRSYHQDRVSNQWRVNGTFGITGSGNPIRSQAPVWSPPRSSGGLPTIVRWPFASIKAKNHIEIECAATLWRFTSGLFFAGLVVLVLRWTKFVRESDRVLLVAGAITVAMLTANLVLIGVGVASMGFALINSVVIGVLGLAMLAGAILGGFVLRVGDHHAASQNLTPETEPTSSAPVTTTDAQESFEGSLLTSVRSLCWWWKIPVYLTFQFFVWGLVAGQSWPVGRDVFGPYRLQPDVVVIAYWGQFVLLPFLTRRFQIFVLSQLLLIVLTYVLPNWPQGGNEFAPFLRIPPGVWPLFGIQFAATLALFLKAPSLGRQLTGMRRRGASDDSP
ncbi:hypothetical protein OAA19_00065 [Rubripirellula sp.]|nr:hypothetical protein [Rubripirellula sp.]MDB4338480.1 hypothetical protein [Rubripirellula sp.]